MGIQTMPITNKPITRKLTESLCNASIISLTRNTSAPIVKTQSHMRPKIFTRGIINAQPPNANKPTYSLSLTF